MRLSQILRNLRLLFYFIVLLNGSFVYSQPNCPIIYGSETSMEESDLTAIKKELFILNGGPIEFQSSLTNPSLIDRVRNLPSLLNLGDGKRLSTKEKNRRINELVTKCRAYLEEYDPVFKDLTELSSYLDELIASYKNVTTAFKRSGKIARQDYLDVWNSRWVELELEDASYNLGKATAKVNSAKNKIFTLFFKHYPNPNPNIPTAIKQAFNDILENSQRSSYVRENGSAVTPDFLNPSNQKETAAAKKFKKQLDQFMQDYVNEYLNSIQ